MPKKHKVSSRPLSAAAQAQHRAAAQAQHRAVKPGRVPPPFKARTYWNIKEGAPYSMPTANLHSNIITNPFGKYIFQEGVKDGRSMILSQYPY